MGKYVSPSLRCLGYTLATAIVLLAILIQSARLLAPSIDHLRPDIERYLSEQLNAQVSIAGLDANWYALRPHLLVDNLSMVNAQGEVLFAVDKADLTLSLLGSLYNFQWTWKKVEFDGVTLQVVEGADRKWSIAGFTAGAKAQAKSRPWTYYDPSDLFTITQDVRLTQAKVAFTFANQRHLETFIPSVLIENNQGFHRLTASANVDEEQVFSLVIEQDDDLLKQGVNAVGFLQFNNFPVEKIAQSIIASAPHAVPAPSSSNQTTAGDKNSALPVAAEQSTIDLSLWLDFIDQQTIEALGNMALSGVSSSLFGREYFLNIPVSTNIRGAFDAAKGWQLGFSDVLLDNTQSIKQLKFEQQSGGNVELALDRIDIKPWLAWLQKHILLPMNEPKAKKISSTLDKVQLNGVIDNLLFSLDGADWQNSFVAANVNNLSLAPWRGIPGFRNVKGYVESTLKQGLLNLSSQDFHIFPDVIYDAPIVFDQIDSQIAWHINRPNNTIAVNSNNIQGQGKFGRLNSYFLLDVPIQPQSRPANLDLHIGLQDSHLDYQEQLTPNRISEDLREWLSSSLTTGDIKQAGFIYRGGLSKKQSKTIQLFFDADNVDVNYSDEWPAIDDVSGQVVIDNEYLEVTGYSASLANNPVKNIKIVWPGGGQKSLSVKADARLSATSALTLLGKGWLGEKLGDTFSSWRGDGDIGLDLDLDLPIPLAGKEPKSKINVVFDRNDFVLTDQNINLQAVTGEVQFSNNKGVFADNLSALLFEQPINLAINQVFEQSLDNSLPVSKNGEHISVSGSSQVEADTLSRWLLSLNDSLKPPKENIVAGIIPYSLNLKIPTSKNKDHLLALAFTSDLRGAEISLPEPYGKSAEQAMPLQVDVKAASESISYQIDLGERVKVNALSNDKNFKGSMAINKSIVALNTIADNAFHIAADVGAVSLEPLLEAVDKYWPSSKPQGGNDLVLHYDVGVDKFLYKDARFDQLMIKGSRDSDAWIFGAECHLFLGDAIVPHNEKTPIDINVKYLNIIKELEPESTEDNFLEDSITDNIQKQDPLQLIDLSVVRPANIAIDQLRYGDSLLGSWRFAVKPIDGGISVDNIYANFSGMLLKGSHGGNVETSSSGASLVWLQGDSQAQSTTSFKGVLEGGDVKQLFDDLELPPLIESKESHFELDVAWQGSPVVLAVEKLQGELQVRLKKGRFLQNKDGSGTGALPLLGLFNFDTLLRRIRLDFTDLYKKGVVFDRVTSRLEFDKQWIYFKEPLLVTSPSSTFNVAGRINYPNKQVDAILVATLPVGGNLTFITALAAGLPAAAGVYIVSKIFSPQVDKASSFNYTITGSWDKPKVNFVKLFDKQAKEGDGSSQAVELIPFEDESLD